jgi:hypothetical protein
MTRLRVSKTPLTTSVETEKGTMITKLAALIKEGWRDDRLDCMVWRGFLFLFLSILPIFFPGPPIETTSKITLVVIVCFMIVLTALLAVTITAILLGLNARRRSAKKERKPDHSR